jgi:hypothetical protein
MTACDGTSSNARSTIVTGILSQAENAFPIPSLEFYRGSSGSKKKPG